MRSFRIPQGLSCCQRIKLILSPIQKHETVINRMNTKTLISVSPEAFRMLFYIGFIVYTLIAMVTTGIWAEVDYDDNILKDRFGSVSLCLFYDYPPFSYFSSALWLPNVFLIVIYFVFDFFRIHDGLKDGELGIVFYRCYCAATVFEILAFSFFLQITATAPEENLFLHTFPFIIVTFAQWTLAFKRLMWFLKMNVLEHYGPCYVYCWRIYVVLMLLVVVGKTLLNVPNLFGAQLWTLKGLEWTAPYSLLNDRLYVLLTMIFPPFIYFVVARDIETVVLVIDRESSHRMASDSVLIEKKKERVREEE